MKSRQLIDSQEAERDKQKTEGNIREDNKKRQQEKKSRESRETHLPYNMVYLYIGYIIANGYILL